MHFQEEGRNFFLTKFGKIWYRNINIDKGVNIFYICAFFYCHTILRGKGVMWL